MDIWRIKAREFNASNLPETCLWCGTKIPPEEIEEWLMGSRTSIKTGEFHPGGYGWSGLFCTLRCGFQFAVTLARKGNRLLPPRKEDNDS